MSAPWGPPETSVSFSSPGMSQGLPQGHPAHCGLAGWTGLRPPCPALPPMPVPWCQGTDVSCWFSWNSWPGPPTCRHRPAGATLVGSCGGKVGSWKDPVVWPRSDPHSPMVLCGVCCSAPQLLWYQPGSFPLGSDLLPVRFTSVGLPVQVSGLALARGTHAVQQLGPLGRGVSDKHPLGTITSCLRLPTRFSSYPISFWEFPLPSWITRCISVGMQPGASDRCAFALTRRPPGAPAPAFCGSGRLPEGFRGREDEWSCARS